MESTTAHIASVLHRARVAAGVTQAELARLVGTNQTAISAYESGSKRPSAATITSILSMLRPPPSCTLERRRDEVIRAVAAHRAHNPRVFGSVARGEDTWRSDIDLLVTFEPGWTLSDLFGMQADLERIFGPGRVDLHSSP
jgi:hypothetical protein